MSLQQVSDDVLAKAAETGRYEIVTIDDLHIDESYQRDLSRDLVERIRREWKTSACGAIVVSQRSNGDLYIVNGQHRTAAAKERGMSEMLAQVVAGLTSQEEAQLRLMGNTRRADSAQERFRAQVAAGNQESIAIQKILSEYGTRINPSVDTKSGINTVAAVEDIYRMDHKGLMLAAVLDVLQEGFVMMGGRNVSSAMLKSIAWFLMKHRPEIDRARFIERLTAEGVDSIDRKARNHKAASGGALWINYYRAMVEVYNQRIPEANRLEIRTGKSSSWVSTGEVGSDTWRKS